MILVFIHELGHFLAARAFGMRVERFSVGFPPKIVGKTIGDTEYVIGATPLGGYVKISGMVDESMDTDFATSVPQPWEFRSKPVWQRIVVITAGVIFNFLLAIVIFAGLKYSQGEVYVPAENVTGVHVREGSVFYDLGLRTNDRLLAVNGKPIERVEDVFVEAIAPNGFVLSIQRGDQNVDIAEPDGFFTRVTEELRNSEDPDILGLSYTTSVLGGVLDGGPAAAAGLQRGDRIISIDGADVRYWAQMRELITESEGRSLAVEFSRPDSLESTTPADAELVGEADGSKVWKTTLTPEIISLPDGELFGIGVQMADAAILSKEFGVVRRDLNLGQSVVAGTQETWRYGSLVLTSLYRVVRGRDSVRQTMGGPIEIGRQTGRALQQGLGEFWRIVAFLSITLGIVNILPIPALDGGHLVFLLYEGITRREPSLKVRIALQNVGMVVLLAFMAFMVINDILRL